MVDRRTGKVVERTWVNNAEKPNVYVGFVIPRDIVRTALQITPDTLGVISADWMRNGWFAKNGLTRTINFTKEVLST